MKIDGILSAIPKMTPAQRLGVRRNAEAMTGDRDKQQAARQVLAALDEQAADDIVTAAERLRVIPTSKRVSDVFTHKKLLVTEQQAVQVLLDHPGSTSTELSHEAGWGSAIWLKRFGALLKKREAGLWPMDADAQNDETFYASLVADLSDDDRWTMKPDVVEAFAKLGVVARSRATA